MHSAVNNSGRVLSVNEKKVHLNASPIQYSSIKDSLPVMANFRGRCLEVMTFRDGWVYLMWMIGRCGSYVPGTANSRSRLMRSLGETYCNSSVVSYKANELTAIMIDPRRYVRNLSSCKNEA